MATHDYVLANQSGAAFRTDLNNALAAIVSNNSNSSEPATKYAYQWWADTSAAVMKLRNSANDGWIELFQLDGTITIEDGTKTVPGLAFRDDLNTGIFSSAADTFNVATGGVERMELGTTTVFNDEGADVDFRIEGNSSSSLFYLDAGNDRIGLRTAAPSKTLDVSGDFCISNSATSRWDFDRDDSSGALIISDTGSEIMRLAVSGTKPVLIGTTTVTSDKFAVLDAGNAFMSIRSDQEADNQTQNIDFATGEAERTSANMTGSIACSIHSQSGGTLKSDMGFSTNSGDSVTQKMVIKDTGNVGIGESSPSAILHLRGSDTAYGGVGNSTTACGAKIRVQDTAGRVMEIVSPGSAAEAGIGSITNHNFTFFVSNTEKARMMSLNLSDPAFLVGCTTSSLGTSSFGIALFYDGFFGVSRDVAATGVAAQLGGNAGVAQVFGDGDLENTHGRYHQISDIKYKENVVDANSQWDDIKAIKVRNFNFKASTGWSTHKQIGIVAQELELTSPALVKTSYDRKNTESHKSVAQSIVYMKALKALQEAMAKIEVLETKVAALEAG